MFGKRNLDERRSLFNLERNIKCLGDQNDQTSAQLVRPTAERIIKAKYISRRQR